MIEVTRVYKSFENPVLRGATLRAERARILGLIGPPGCGKSLLLRAISGLITVDAGSIVVRGQQVVGASAVSLRDIQRQVGMLFQNVALFDALSVFDNVAFPLRRLHRGRDLPIADRVARELEAVGLTAHAHKMPSELSGGQRRRVGLARAAVTAPRVLLYDEPAAGLDPVTTSRAFSLLKEQTRRLGAALIVVSSDIERLLPICDQVAMMHQGRIIFQGSEAEIRALGDPLVQQFLSGSEHGPL